MSYEDDEGFGAYSLEDFGYENKCEYNWKKGFHITKDDEKILLKDMTIQHLNNTIKYFEYTCDVSILEEELNRRNLTNN